MIQIPGMPVQRVRLELLGRPIAIAVGIGEWNGPAVAIANPADAADEVTAGVGGFVERNGGADVPSPARVLGKSLRPCIASPRARALTKTPPLFESGVGI